MLLFSCLEESLFSEGVTKDSIEVVTDDDELLLHHLDTRVPERKPTPRDTKTVQTRMVTNCPCGSMDLEEGGGFKDGGDRLWRELLN